MYSIAVSTAGDHGRDGRVLVPRTEDQPGWSKQDNRVPFLADALLGLKIFVPVLCKYRIWSGCIYIIQYIICLYYSIVKYV